MIKLLKEFSHRVPRYSKEITANGINSVTRTRFSTTPTGWNALNVDDVNQNMRRLEYAVRGPIVMRAVQLEKEIREGSKKPFKSVISANIGDCHAMNQKPITFIRQTLACASDTRLLDSPDVPSDVKERVREVLADCNGNSIGSYTDSWGVEVIRQHVARYIQERDGVSADWHNVFLSTGASQCVKMILSLANYSRKPGKPPGVMIPIPQYPLYSATLCEFGMHQANYYLNEDSNWSLNIDELRRAYNENQDKSDVRVLVVINPGNPTGSVLSEENIVEILDFAAEHKLMVIADEVYQHNVYNEKAKFHSFKKVMTTKTSHKLELASMMSASKGYMGECGLRGGYCEILNFNDDVRAVLNRGLSSWLCSSVLGQITMDCVVNPPRPGQESFALYETEKNKVLADLKRKAKLAADTLNSVEGVSSNEVAGAMYAFPRLTLPQKAIDEAKKLNVKPDYFYVMKFLENFGVCVVPGSGFGQQPGTYHFRTTILPQPDVFEDMMDRFKQYHTQFLNEYS